MESRIPFYDGVGKRKTKLEVRIPFSHIVGKQLALRYTHSLTGISCRDRGEPRPVIAAAKTIYLIGN